MNKFVREITAALERGKAEYRFVFYDPKADQIRLVASRYELLPHGTQWLRYYDGEMYGRDIRLDRAKHWVGIGAL